MSCVLETLVFIVVVVLTAWPTMQSSQTTAFCNYPRSDSITNLVKHVLLNSNLCFAKVILHFKQELEKKTF